MMPEAIRCFGCRKLFEDLEEYKGHATEAACQLSGETMVSVKKA